MPIIAAGQTVILREPADHTAAWLAFIGAVLVALIAAGTAQWRLRRQLSDEAKRLGSQLDHDRHMADVADLRRVLKRALDVYERRRQLVEQMHLKATGSPIRTRPMEELQQAVDATFDVQQSTTNSLRIRLGLDDPLYQAVVALSSKLGDMVSAVGHPAEYAAAEAERGAAYQAAVAAASARVGSRIG